MRVLAYCFLVMGFVMFGCCCTFAPSSSSGGLAPSAACARGTYGESCSSICNMKPGIENCFSQCMDAVRAEGMGDATTCCKETFRESCYNQCARFSGDAQAHEECLTGCFDILAAAEIPESLCYVPV